MIGVDYRQLPTSHIEIRAHSEQGLTFIGVADTVEMRHEESGDPYTSENLQLGTRFVGQPMAYAVEMKFRLTIIEVDVTKYAMSQFAAFAEAMAAAHPSVSVVPVGMEDLDGVDRAEREWVKREGREAEYIARLQRAAGNYNLPQSVIDRIPGVFSATPVADKGV